MGMGTVWLKIFRNRWICSAAAGLAVLLFCSPCWSYGSGLHPEPLSIQPMLPIEGAFSANEVLSKKDKKWKDLSPEEKEKLRRKYKEWQSLSPKEKEKMRRRMDRLNDMSPRERKIYNQLYKKWRHLPPAERKKLERELDNWENLSPRQQEAIRRRFMK